MEMTYTLISLVCGAVLATLVVTAIVFGYLAYRRRLRHRELMAMVEKGLVDVQSIHRNGNDLLRWGIVITALGLALCLGLYPLGFVIGSNFPLMFGPWMLIGLIPTFFGLALILIHLVSREHKPKREEHIPEDEGKVED